MPFTSDTIAHEDFMETQLLVGFPIAVALARNETLPEELSDQVTLSLLLPDISDTEVGAAGADADGGWLANDGSMNNGTASTAAAMPAITPRRHTRCIVMSSLSPENSIGTSCPFQSPFKLQMW